MLARPYRAGRKILDIAVPAAFCAVSKATPRIARDPPLQGGKEDSKSRCFLRASICCGERSDAAHRTNCCDERKAAAPLPCSKRTQNAVFRLRITQHVQGLVSLLGCSRQSFSRFAVLSTQPPSRRNSQHTGRILKNAFPPLQGGKEDFKHRNFLHTAPHCPRCHLKTVTLNRPIIRIQHLRPNVKPFCLIFRIFLTKSSMAVAPTVLGP